MEWGVIHTKPRCEKRIAQHCRERGIRCELPLYKSVRVYQKRKLVFLKPCFPGYVFVYTSRETLIEFRRNIHTANVLFVLDQKTFESQLEDILRAVANNENLLPDSAIKVGCKVRIARGPMKGILGKVEQRSGLCTVYLTLDFIGGCVSFKADSGDLELVE